MSSTPNHHLTTPRINRAFVQVPPSPWSLSAHRVRGYSIHVEAKSNLKENTPVRPFQMTVPQHTASSTSLKRKISEREPASLVFDGVVVPLKKSKLSIRQNEAPPNVKQMRAEEATKKINLESSEELVYCHQCNKKRDVNGTVPCTFVIASTTVSGKVIERPCRYKFCRQCLKNRYNEDIDVFKSQNLSFTCPRCRNVCNCPRCRKLQGLQPIGIIGNPWAKSSKDQNSAHERQEKSKATEADISNDQDCPSLKRRLPVLEWKRIPINLIQDEADERIIIREFIFRFGDFMEPAIAKTHLEELELLGGRGKSNGDETTGWVSEACVKAIILGLLGFLAKCHEACVAKIVKTAMKDIRAGGVNLNRLWGSLLYLRNSIADIPSMSSAGGSKPYNNISLDFPNPTPPPPPVSAVMNSRSLRNIRVAENQVTVVQTSQMVPILLSLIHSALETSFIREEIEQGLKDSRDVVQSAREATRIENERWEKERNNMETAPKNKAVQVENRIKRATHREQMTNIDNALKIVASSFAPRFTTLGTDSDGRVYYALSPGVAEREAALEYLEIASSDKILKPKKKGRVLTIGERRETREWSWFISVWGKKPPTVANLESNNDSEEDDQPSWWGFWDSDEICRLAEWISVKSDLEQEDETLAGSSMTSYISTITSLSKGNCYSPSQPRIEQLKRLVTGLRDYSTLLQWRAREDKYTVVKQTSQVIDKGKDKE